MVKDDELLIPCPNCNELSPESRGRLVENDILPCAWCAGLIDLAADDCRPIVEQARASLRRDAAVEGTGTEHDH